MNEIIKAANFPMQPNKSQTLAGKSLLLFLNYGEGATVENPKWGLFAAFHERGRNRRQ